MTMEGQGGCGGRGSLIPALHIDEGHTIFPLQGGVDFGEKNGLMKQRKSSEVLGGMFGKLVSQNTVLYTHTYI